MANQLILLVKPTVERFPKLAMTYRYVRDWWATCEEPQETKMGFKLLGSKAMRDGEFEPEETAIVKRLLPSVDMVINVGANVGYYCCIALSQGKNVIAFEPVTLNLRCLLKNVKANKWLSRLELHPVAVTDKVGVVDIYGSGSGASLVRGWAGNPEGHVKSVASTTLDTALGRRFQGKECLVIVDVEGAEQLVLEGASLILGMRPKPIWMTEVVIAEHQPKGVTINPSLSSTFNLFWSHGYEAWTADARCRRVDPDEIREIVRSGSSTLDTHNFLFIEKGKKQEFLSTS